VGRVGGLSLNLANSALPSTTTFYLDFEKFTSGFSIQSTKSSTTIHKKWKTNPNINSFIDSTVAVNMKELWRPVRHAAMFSCKVLAIKTVTPGDTVSTSDARFTAAKPLFVTIVSVSHTNSS